MTAEDRVDRGPQGLRTVDHEQPLLFRFHAPRHQIFQQFLHHGSVFRGALLVDRVVAFLHGGSSFQRFGDPILYLRIRLNRRSTSNYGWETLFFQEGNNKAGRYATLSRASLSTRRCRISHTKSRSMGTLVWDRG